MNITANIKHVFLFFCLMAFSAFTGTVLPTINLNTFKWGLKDSATAEVILRAEYDHIASFRNGMAICRQGLNYGLIDEKGQVIYEPIYTHCHWENDNLLKLQKGDLYGLVNASLEEVIPFRFKSLLVYDNYLVVNNGNKSGIIDLKGNIIIPFVYDEIFLEYNPAEGSQLNSYHIRVGINDKYGLIDYANRIVIPIEYDFLNFWPNDIVLAARNGSFGLLNVQGDTLMNFGQYEFSDPLSEGLISASIDSSYGYIDLEESVIIPFMYENAHRFQFGMGTVQKNGFWGAVNKRNEVLIPFEHKSPIVFYNGIACLEREVDGMKKFGFMNLNWELITDFKYDEATLFNQNFAKVRIGNKWGVVDKNGTEIITIQYDKILVRYGYVVASVNEDYGLYQLNGAKVLKDEYDFVYPSRGDEFIMVRMGRKYGYVNQSGKTVIPLIYNNARNFSGDRASVLLNGESFEIDRKGKRIGEK